MSLLAEKIPFLSLLQGSMFANLLRGRGKIVPRPRSSNGLRLEAEEVMRCLALGKTESDIMPLEDTLAVMKTLEDIRAAW